MRVFFSVGEPSGDLHASNLVKQLKQADETIECVGFGGPKMEQAGCQLLFDLTSMAVMFFWDVIRNYGFFKGLLRDADQYMREHPIDAVVLIDYPGFNWNIAKIAKRRGIPVYYYGVPQMWAWAPWRIRKIRKYVDHVLCKLPFEVEWFRKRGCHATYVGHPYFDQLEQQQYDSAFIQKMKPQDPESNPLLVLLPGSRDREVATHLPLMVRAVQEVKQHLEVSVGVACYNDKQQSQAKEILEEAQAGVDEFPLYVGRTPELMKSATACLACSGSVSLELMYHRKPTVILYRIGRLMYFLQSIFLRTKYITLVNLISTPDIEDDTWATYNPDHAEAADVPMPEYLTCSDPSAAVARRLARLLSQPETRKHRSAWLDKLATQYAKPGATSRAAEYLLKTLGVPTKKTGMTSNANLNGQPGPRVGELPAA